MLVLGTNDKEQIHVGAEVVLRFRKSSTGGGCKILIEATDKLSIKRTKDTIENLALAQLKIPWSKPTKKRMIAALSIPLSLENNQAPAKE